MKLRPLYDHQKAPIDKIDAAFTSVVKRIILQAPTGFGKTLTAAHLIAEFIRQGKRVCFVVPRLTLIDQSVAAFGREGFVEHIGVIHSLTNHRRLLQIASRDRLTRRQLPKIDLFIVDEAHMVSTALLKLLGSVPATPVIGLSATPWTKGLGKHFHKLIVAETTGRQDHCRRLQSKQLAEAVNKRDFVGDIVRHWLQFGENRQTLCFAVDRAHAKHICQRFVEAGVPAKYVDCHTIDLDRREIVDRFRRGEIRIICNVGVFTTGLDVPITSCIIDAHPTRSEMLHVQTIGRGLRPAPGKKDCIILDHAGNSLRLVLVTDVVREELCDGSATRAAKRKSKERRRHCRACATSARRSFRSTWIFARNAGRSRSK
jgi:DNA repair protein RadD